MARSLRCRGNPHSRSRARAKPHRTAFSLGTQAWPLSWEVGGAEDGLAVFALAKLKFSLPPEEESLKKEESFSCGKLGGDHLISKTDR